MSRSYKKVVRLGVCWGSNTDFYRRRRRKFRTVNRQMLRNLLANQEIDDVNDSIELIKFAKKDTWSEPTDGSYLISNKNKDYYIKIFGEDWFNKKIGKYLKNKSRGGSRGSSWGS